MAENEHSERDTHFANAAKLLVEKTMATNAMDVVDAQRFLRDDDITELQTLFAQFAYDLVAHTLNHTSHIDLDRLTLEEHVERIPDLTALPDTSPQSDTSPPH